MGTFPHIVSGQDLWAWRERAIAQAQINAIDLAEVDWLLQGLCQIDILSLRLKTLPQQPSVATQCTLSELEALWQQRVRERVPVQHLVGKVLWRQFTLRVSPDVLIPRPETELIIDIAVERVVQHPHSKQMQQGTWVDLGTGSGAIALGLATVFPTAEIVAVDVSPAALAIAQDNAQENGLGDRICFQAGNWFEPLSNRRGKIAGIVSNPPYIPHAIVPTLDPEVTQHEPHLALDGGEDGLDAIRHLAQEAPKFLQPGGVWLVELMAGQAPTVMKLLAATQQFHSISSYQDLAGIERFVAAQSVANF